MNDFLGRLKNAICSGDIIFLEENKGKYSINDRFSDENNDTLLLYALSDSGSNAYLYFLKNQADVSLLNDEGENIIHSVVYSGRPERLAGILDQNNMNHQSKDGTTPLLLAVALEKVGIAQYLIGQGANVNISDHENNAPLHIACHLGYTVLVSDLVNKGADLFVKTRKGNLPLALAVNGGYADIVRLLFNRMY